MYVLTYLHKKWCHIYSISKGTGMNGSTQPMSSYTQKARLVSLDTSVKPIQQSQDLWGRNNPSASAHMADIL